MKRLLAALVLGLTTAGCTSEPAEEEAIPTPSPSPASTVRVPVPADLMDTAFRDDCQLVVRIVNDDRLYREIGPKDLLGKRIGSADGWCAGTRPDGEPDYFPPEGKSIYPVPVRSIPGEKRDSMIAVGWPHQGCLAMKVVPGITIG
jgi:hypothetical protein